MDDFHLTGDPIASLKILHRTLRDRKTADRVKAVVLLGTGWTVANVAEALLVDEKTVRLWYEKYVHGGEQELIALFYQGKERSLVAAIVQKNRIEASEIAKDSSHLGQCELLHFEVVKGKADRIEDCITLFTGLFTELEFDRTTGEVFQEKDTL
jgi:hypothetical protein